MARSFSLWQLSDELRSLSRASEEDQKWNLVASKLAIVEQMRAQTEDGDISSSIDSKTNRADDGFFPKLNINSSSSSGCFFNARIGGIARNGGNKINSNSNSNSNNNNNSYSNASYSGAVAGTQQQQTSGNVTDKRFKCLPPAETLPWQETLGGYIFVCNNDTMLEDLKRQLFGRPTALATSMWNVFRRDIVTLFELSSLVLPLFLYNYTTHQLHGIFEAASFGGSNIDPTAWGDKKNKGESRFPAQVRTRVRKLCKPLEEDSFRPVLHHYDGPKFRLQLSVPETLALLDLFEEAGSS